MELNPHTLVGPSDFDFITINYSSAIIAANTNSSYQGVVQFNYKMNFDLQWTSSTKVLRVDAYNLEQSDSETLSFEFNASLGREKFLKSFSKLNYHIKGYTWDNQNGTDNFDIGPFYDNTLGQTKLLVNPLEISSQNGTSDLVYRHYSYVNAMETTATISYKWNNNTLKVSVYLKVYAYATAWNA